MACLSCGLVWVYFNLELSSGMRCTLAYNMAVQGGKCRIKYTEMYKFRPDSGRTRLKTLTAHVPQLSNQSNDCRQGDRWSMQLTSCKEELPRKTEAFVLRGASKEDWRICFPLLKVHYVHKYNEVLQGVCYFRTCSPFKWFCTDKKGLIECEIFS